MLLSVSALTGGGSGNSRSKPGRPEDVSTTTAVGEKNCCSCGSSGGGCDVNANCELTMRASGGGRGSVGEEEEEMDLADRPEPEGLNETDGQTGRNRQ